MVIFYPGVHYCIAPAPTEELEHYYVRFSGLPGILLGQFAKRGVATFPIRRNPMFKDRFVSLMNGTSVPPQLAVHNANSLLYLIINETIHLYQDTSKSSADSAIVEPFPHL